MRAILFPTILALTVPPGTAGARHDFVEIVALPEFFVAEHCPVAPVDAGRAAHDIYTTGYRPPTLPQLRIMVRMLAEADLLLRLDQGLLAPADFPAEAQAAIGRVLDRLSPDRISAGHVRPLALTDHRMATDTAYLLIETGGETGPVTCTMVTAEDRLARIVLTEDLDRDVGFSDLGVQRIEQAWDKPGPATLTLGHFDGTILTELLGRPPLVEAIIVVRGTER